jgi:hypothetical protein
VRVHGTTKAVPMERFATDEQPRLAALPPHAYRSLLLEQRAPIPSADDECHVVGAARRGRAAESRDLRSAGKRSGRRRMSGARIYHRHLVLASGMPAHPARGSQDARCARGPRRHPAPSRLRAARDGKPWSGSSARTSSSGTRGACRPRCVARACPP